MRAYKRWSYHDPHLYFAEMNPRENKRAVLSISDRSTIMTASEIGTARELTDLLYGWLSGRTDVPRLPAAIPDARIYLSAIGGTSIVDALETFGDLEVVSSVTIGAVYPHGQPRRPQARFLPPVSDIRTKAELEELQCFEALLSDSQAAGVRSAIDRVAGVFRKRLRMRKALLSRRIAEVFGYSFGVWEFEGQKIDDEMIMGYQFKQILSWLKDEGERNRKVDRSAPHVRRA
jgi:hypothetical protein